MSGRRPDASRTWNFINHFREDHPDWTSLPGLFLNAGKKALAAGKTYHPKMPPKYDSHKSWSSEALPYNNPCWNTGDQEIIDFQDGGLPCVFCPADIKSYVFGANNSVATDWCELDAYEDTLSVNEAIRMLRKAKDKHFYLAVGMHKPHQPWQALPEDFAKHPLESIDLCTNPLPPKGVPEIALHMTDGDLPEHTDPWHPVNGDNARLARRAYRASLTGMDRKLGKLLDELDDLGLTDKTAIIFHGDHGWHLGEHGLWQKMSNFETVARVPLIIKMPGQAGGRADGLVELVDLMPTVADLAGIPLPEGEGFGTKQAGVSLVPILTGTSPEVKSVAFSQYPRRALHADKLWYSNSILHHERDTFTHMGYSVRTVDWRYTEWLEWNQTTLQPIFGKVTGRELYDHRNEIMFPTDFNNHENENFADDEAYADVVASLSQMVRDQFGSDVDDVMMI